MAEPSALPARETSGEARVRQCERKMMYPDQAAAKNGAEAMRHKTHRSQQFNTYYCEFCYGWHVGRARTKEQGIRRAQRQSAA